MTPRDLDRLLSDPAVWVVEEFNKEERTMSSETDLVTDLQAEIDRTNQDLTALHAVTGQQELFFEAVWQSEMPDDRKAMWLYKVAAGYWQQRDQLAAALRALVDRDGEFMDGIGEVWCFFCEGKAQPRDPMPHEEGCPIAVGRRVLAELDG